MPVIVATAVLLTSIAYAQNSERVMPLAHSERPQAMQEIATTLRTVALIRELSVSPESKSVAVRGTAGQLALAEWLVRELDQPANASAPHEYRMPANGDDVVRVFHLNPTQTPQGLLEIGTALRTVGDIRMLFACNAPRALALRGTAGQSALAEWLVQELDAPAGQSPAPQEYRVPGNGDEVVRVFYLSQDKTPQGIQEIQTTIRTVADVRKMFQVNAARAVALRGTAGQMALSEWLVQHLDPPAGLQRPAMRESPVPDSGDVVRVLYLAPTTTPQALQEIGTAIRTISGIQRLFPLPTVRALAMRGTADQVARAEQLAR